MRRSQRESSPVQESVPGPSEHERRRLRDERDPDDLVEEATARLRDTLITLDARDEWGRAIAWRQVVRIALAPMLAELRDARTISRLTAMLEQRGPDVLEFDVSPTTPWFDIAERMRADDDPSSATGWPFVD